MHNRFRDDFGGVAFVYGVFHHALGQAAHPIVDRQRLVGLGLVVLALLSVGGISSLTTSYRTGYITEAELLGVETTIKRAVASCAGLERYLRSTTAPPSRST